jgi:MFS transporter, putative metabolite:H+ symporter
MASKAGGIPHPVAGAGSTAAAVIARQDRIPTWALSYLFIGIIGVGFLFTFLDFLQSSVLSLSSTIPAPPNCPANRQAQIGA